MIKFADIQNLNLIEKFNVDDVFSLRIRSLLASYGTSYDFARFWVQIIEDDVTAIMSKFDNDFTLSYAPNADKQELAEFVFAIGFSTLQCDESFSLEAKNVTGDILISEPLERLQCDDREFQIAKNTDISDIFRLNYGEVKNKDAYMNWYADILHRIRHGTACSYVLKLDDEAVSSVVFSSIDRKNVLISHVATEENQRNKGFASSLIKSVCSEKDFKYYILTDNEQNKRFYEKLAFVKVGRWKVYKNDTIF